MPQSAFHFMAQHTGELILVQAKGNDNSAQAAWRMEVQGQFLGWLGAGGFHSAVETMQVQSTNRDRGSQSSQLPPSHTTWHAGPYRAAQEAEVK